MHLAGIIKIWNDICKIVIVTLLYLNNLLAVYIHITVCDEIYTV